MDLSIALLTVITFITWGVGTFLSKLATNKIGDKASFYYAISFFLCTTIYGLFIYKFKNLINLNRSGILIALLAGALETAGFIGFFMLINKAQASSMVPLTALYPAVTVILAFIFLHEEITFPKILGIIFSLIAIYLLSK